MIPLLLEGGTNIIGQASTGTGKTAAFGIPLIEKLQSSKKIQALILVPTRELANQVAAEIDSFQSKKSLNILAIYGGQSYTRQLSALKRGVDIIVATPGRMIDYLDRKVLNLGNLQYLILDEADEMLNMGFVDDIEKIFKQTNPDQNVLLFSATMPRAILQVAKKYMGDYQLISSPKTAADTAQTSQIYFEVQERDKLEALCRIIDVEPDFYGIVFCKTKLDVDELVGQLIKKGYKAQGLHGDILQKQREIILKNFKEKNTQILIATDVAARGIDVDNISHVINYALPQDSESYIHRIGRTGRAGRSGIAITFVSPQEYRKLVFLQRDTKNEIEKAKIPSAQEIIDKKKEQFFADITAIVDGEGFHKYFPLAAELLEQFDPQELAAAFLMLNYQSEFDLKKYRDLNEVRVDNKGKTRLFVALGKKAGLSPRSLVDLLVQKAKISSKVIDDVRVMEDFSFLTVPYLDAEQILRSFKEEKSGGKSLISKAKEDRSRGGNFRQKRRGRR